VGGATSSGGISSGFDELNLIEKGKNYGWPKIQGGESREGMEKPIIHSGIDTWAPAGAAFWEGSIFFGGLRGAALYEAVLNEDNSVILKTHFLKKFGRIRAVRIGTDGMIYFTTSNRDGRGKVREGDDKIIRVNPMTFR